MTRPFQKHLASPFLCLLLLVSWTPSASATLIVDWGGNYTTSDMPLQAGGFVGTTPSQVSPASGYSGTSDRFFGMIQTNDNLSQMIIDDAGGPDRLQFKVSNTFARSYEALVLWTSQDFLGAAQNQAVTLPSASDTIAITVNTHVQVNPSRLVLQRGTDYYISEGMFSESSATLDYDINPTTLSWYGYDPSTTLDFNVADESGNDVTSTVVVAGEIAGITGIGVFSSREATAQANAMRFSSFEVDAVIVPEPSSAAIALGGLLALLPIMLWRRRKSRVAIV